MNEEDKAFKAIELNEKLSFLREIEKDLKERGYIPTIDQAIIDILEKLNALV